MLVSMLQFTVTSILMSCCFTKISKDRSLIAAKTTCKLPLTTTRSDNQTPMNYNCICDNNPMRTLKSGVVTQCEIEVKRSRFICSLFRTDTEDSARDFINQIRSTYPDARHNCSAYIIHPDGLNPLMHSSDDAEPAGTAGMPMLEVLRHSALENLTAVVTRYFGGILLGTGGLVRAYSQATQQGLSQAPLVEINTYDRFRVSVPLAVAGKIEGELRSAGWNIVDTQWSDQLQIEIAAHPEDQSHLSSQISSLTRSEVVLRKVGIIRYAVDIPSLNT